VGKTPLAKTLAAYLFGDAERLLRFDMNEFVAPGAAARLVGTFADPEGVLTSAVRRQPFCVVLLDEIEKAHPDVLDLLLQVMGEGRLTDALGRTTDFGNAIVILTSNLGTREAGTAVGFRSGASSDAPHYLRAAERFFRPEFFNRLDRIVPFDRLSRDEVRQIAELVIHGVFQRQGLVRRKCVLQVEPQALDRVVERGYHPELGARALKREIERQLTQPVSLRLAATPPDAATVISLYPARAGIAVEVQTLVEAQPASTRRRVPPNDDDPEPCRRRLQAIQATLARVQTRLAAHRPGGSIEPGKMALEHYHYFLAKEQAGQLREGVERLADAVDRPVRGRHSPPAISPVRRKTLAHWEPNERPLLREMAAVDDIHTYLREAFGTAPRFGHQLAHQVEQLEYDAALLEAMSRFDDTTAGDAVVLISAQGQRQTFADEMLRRYLALFGEGLALDCRPLEVEEPMKALVVSGPHALAMASLEEGTHLFCPPHANLVPVPVWTLAAACNDVAEFSHRRREWLRALADGSGRVEDDPYPLPPVVRIYNADGPTFDLRSGLSAPGNPTPDDLRTFLLATLPPPPELM
jgi:hypothetical protein